MILEKSHKSVGLVLQKSAGYDFISGTCTAGRLRPKIGIKLIVRLIDNNLKSKMNTIIQQKMRYFMNRKSKLYSMSAYFNKFGFTFTLERDLDELFLSNLIFSSRDFFNLLT